MFRNTFKSQDQTKRADVLLTASDGTHSVMMYENNKLVQRVDVPSLKLAEDMAQVYTGQYQIGPTLLKE